MQLDIVVGKKTEIEIPDKFTGHCLASVLSSAQIEYTSRCFYSHIPHSPCLLRWDIAFSQRSHVLRCSHRVHTCSHGMATLLAPIDLYLPL